MVNGPPALIGGNCNNHLPSVLAVALKFFPLNLIFIFSPFEAHPQIFIFESRCKTMLSLISRGRLTWAVVTSVILKNKETAKILRVHRDSLPVGSPAAKALRHLCPHVAEALAEAQASAHAVGDGTRAGL